MDFRKRDFDAVGIIPARLESTRLEKKLLLEINGKPLISYVIENVIQSKYLKKIILASDSDDIINIGKSYNIETFLTKGNFPTGTDRIAYAYKELDDYSDIVFNIQADEPLLTANLIDNLYEKFTNTLCHVGTLIKKIKTEEELFSPNVVKAVLQNDNSALYFSRSPIPYFRDLEMSDWIKKQVFWKHIGVYVYRKEALEAFTKLPRTDLEIAENLEQLRLLQNNFKYFCLETNEELFGIDTEKDYLKFKSLTENNV